MHLPNSRSVEFMDKSKCKKIIDFDVILRITYEASFDTKNDHT